MANTNLLTNSFRVAQVDQTYYSPTSVVYGSNNTISSTYCFLSRIDPWSNDNNPDIPTDSQAYVKQVYKNIFVAKKIESSDISPVIQRNNWTANTIYDYYSDTVNMTDKDPITGVNTKNYYINNSYNQVFKCLWNGNGNLSTHEPIFQPGTYGTNNIYTSTDNYKWKYMYTIDVGSQIKFMDSKWIPIPVDKYTSDAANPLTHTAGYGDIEVINVTNGGTGYTPSQTPTVRIIGDGFNATANVVLHNGAISDITVKSAGYNYTTAVSTISINAGGGGSGAVIIAPISPVGGHGADPIAELGCCNIMYTCTFNGSEGGKVPTTIDYRQVGLMINPIDTNTTPETGTDSIYKVSTDFILSSGNGEFLSDENISQTDSTGNISFSATSLCFDTAANILSFINVTGIPVINRPVIGALSGCARNLVGIDPSILVPQSGYITYIENRSGIQRSVDGIEQIKFVLSF